MGSVGVLNVGAGDTKLTFDKDNPAEAIRAARIITDMMRRGYVLLVDVGDGKYQRARGFDEAKQEYIIADFDPVTAARCSCPPDGVSSTCAIHGDGKQTGLDDGPGIKTEAAAADAAASGGKTRRKGRGPSKRLRADRTNAVAVGRTAGG